MSDIDDIKEKYMPDGTHFIRVPLDTAVNGDAAREVVVEVEALTSGIERAARPGEIVATATQTLAEGFDHVRAAAEILLNRLAHLSSPPRRIEVELGVKLSAEAGAIIAKSAGEGSFLVRLVWEGAAGQETDNVPCRDQQADYQ